MTGRQVMYCDKCRGRPGTPTLCESCQANQDTITKLHQRVRGLKKALEAIEAAVTFAVIATKEN